MSGNATGRRSRRIVRGDVFRRIVAARDYAEAAFDEPITVADLAGVAGVSRYHFLRTFQRVYGVTPRQYLTRVRLDEARRLLARGLPVTEVCLEVGFSSLGSFSTLFRRHVGVSPRAYQRDVRRLIQVPERIGAVRVPHCFLSFFGA